MRDKIIKIFKKDKRTCSSTFNPSAPITLRKKKKESKHVASTRMTSNGDIIKTPSEKVKKDLREKDRIGQLVLTEEDTSDIITEKILNVFPHFINSTDKIQFLCSTTSNDLFEIELPQEWNANYIFQTYGKGSVYVRIKHSEPPLQPAKNVQPVKPCVFATVIPDKVIKGKFIQSHIVIFLVYFHV